MDFRVKDITGQTFNQLTAIRPAGRTKGGHIKWLCKCDCGNEIAVDGNILRRKIQKSCGCAHKKWTRDTIHGRCDTTEYKSWRGMHNRCYNKNNPKYPTYGGRGIKVCAEWHDAKTFLDDMGEKPSKLHSINRIDNDGDYNKENCEWATPKEQANNKTTNRIIFYGGRSMTLSQWSDHLNINFGALRMRLHRGWGIAKSFNTPLIQKVA